MKKFAHFLVTTGAIVLIALFATDSAVAKERHTITVMVVDVEGSKVLMQEYKSPNLLSDVYDLDRGHANRGQLRRGADKLNIDGMVDNMRANLRGGAGKRLTAELSNALGSNIPERRPFPDSPPDPGGGSSCLKAYRSGDGDVICTGQCRDCYVEQVPIP